MGTKQSIDQLNSFLRGELSAVETYRMAIAKLDDGSPARGELEACMASHQDRVQMLRDAIIMSGGEPAEGSGPWGVFAKTVEGGARIFGDKAAIAALEEGEDHGLDDYKDDLEDLDTETRRLVTDRLLPLQRQTHDRMSSLKKRLAAKQTGRA
ncbi:MAG: DUF2383 domain-containing protein [Deltaproteobacteria bacterium]|nr:DUF2383 domain-containing protein [Deltaproteobacteria bacterium]